MEDFVTRFSQLIQKLGLSNSRFADELGVQRSSISHIMSGRNKPGFDFLDKIVKSFPRVNTDWLISGRGAMFLDMAPVNDPFTQNRPESGVMSFEMDEKKPVSSEVSSQRSAERPAERPESSSSGIESILILFKDGSFREYHS